LAIYLCLAPAATGKTAFALAQARQAARGLRGCVHVCVANQVQRRSWKERLADTGGAIGVRVLTFGQLYRELLGLVGAAVTELDDPVQHRLLRAILERVPLVHYRSLLDKPGFPVLLHDLLAELKAAGISPAAFATAVTALGDEPRLRELALIYAAYQEMLRASGWADEEELGLLALRAAENSPTLGTDWPLFVLDGFDSLTTVQLRLVGLLATRARETLITLTGSLEGSEPRLVQRRFSVTRRALEMSLGIGAEPLPSCCVRQVDPLAHLERSLFTDHAPQPAAEANTQAVTLIAAADRAGEVRAALRWLKARLVLDGCSAGEVALLARNVAPYRPFIQQTADEFGIPVRLLDGQPLATIPVVAALLDLLRLFLPLAADSTQPALPRRLVVEAWRSPYYDWGPLAIEPGDAERLDGVARWGRVIGGSDQWREAFERLKHRAARAAEDDEEWPTEVPDAQVARDLGTKFDRFVDWLTPPAPSGGVSGYVDWIETLIGTDQDEETPDDGSLRVVQCARRGGGGSAEWDVAALRALKDVLRSLVWAESALGPPVLTDFAAFYADLEAAIASATCYLPDDPRADEVLVADVVQARGVPFRAVAVLGLAEGEFPASLQEDPLLRDADRERLRALGLALESSTQSAELGYFYEAINRPREKLLLTRPRLAENGATWEASPYWEELRRLSGVQPETLTSEACISLEQAASWPEVFEGLAGLPADSPWHPWARSKDIGHYLAWQTAGTMLRGRFARRPSGEDNGDLGSLSPELALRYGPDRTWSASRLESYRSCPHSFFISSVLKLESREEPAEGLDGRQLGNIYHRLLQQVYEGCSEDARNQPDRLLAALERVAEAILDEAPAREGFRESAWWLETRDEILDNASRSLEALTEHAGGYVPWGFERLFDCEIGSDAPGEPGVLRLHGVIDRLDRALDGSWRIIDYKTAGPSAFGKAALEDGKKLQLPLYALGAQCQWDAQVRDGFYWHVQHAEPSKLSLQEYGVEQALHDALQFAWEAVRGVRAGWFIPHPPAEGCPEYCLAVGFCFHYRAGYRG
jgi:ATP-dependent helicase/nuclease subunit B